MASIKLYFDKRVNRKDGKVPLKINVTHKRQQALINLGILLSPDQWDSTKGKVINGPNKSFLNGYISQRVHCAETELLNLRIAGKLDLMTGKQFKEHLQRILLRGKLEEKQEDLLCSIIQGLWKERKIPKRRQSTNIHLIAYVVLWMYQISLDLKM